MAPSPGFAAAVAVLLAGAALAAVDLHSVSARTIVVYTTPALRDLWEKEVAPRFQNDTGHRVALVYVPAGQQYNRLRLSEGAPEADLLVHGSPLYLARGADEGLVTPYRLAADATIADAHKAAARGGQGGPRAFYAFAWSPLVSVAAEGKDLPDLAAMDGTFGFAHPLLSNNGVYNVLFFEHVDPAAGQRALAHTRVQPVNARSTIGGLADGSFDLTLGYEAVTQFYRAQGAKVAYDLPVLDGARWLVPVLFSAGLVAHHPHPAAEQLLERLFEPVTQERLGRFWFRPVVGNATAEGLVPIEDAQRFDPGWSDWQAIEAVLPDYVVTA